jgi:hypothetical protein
MVCVTLTLSLNSVKYTVNRQGGNAETAYNWQYGVSNRAFDWYFENIPDSVANPANLPEGTDMTNFVDATKNSSAAIVLTATTIGYVAVDNRTKLCSYPISKYGTQDDEVDNCGNGEVNGNRLVDTDLSLNYKAVDETYVTQEMQFLKAR